MSDYHGHKTLADGSHVQLTSGEAERLWKDAMRQKEDRAAKLPDEQSAIRAMCEAHTRLKELGWSETMYCPKDGTHFQVIENGSTGIFDSAYKGKWPDGHWMTFDETDCYPSSIAPALFKRYPEDEAKHKAKMKEAAEQFRLERAKVGETP